MKKYPIQYWPALILSMFVCHTGIAQPLNAEAIKSLQLTGPFTLTYSVTHRDVASAATKAELLQGITLSYDMALKNHQMSQSDRDDAVKQAQMGQDFPATSGTITLSVSGNRLLCSEDGLDNGPGQTVVYDGKQTLELTRAENNMQRIVTGLDRWTDIHPLLVPGVGTPYAPLIEMPTLEGSKTQNSLQTFSGDVVMNGSRMVPGEVQATFVDGRPKVLSLRELTLSKNRVVRRWDYLEHQLFDGCWIGSRMKFTTYDREQRPIAEFDMKLITSIKKSVAPDEFRIEHWLRDNVRIAASIDQDSIDFQYHVGEGGWHAQAIKALHRRPQSGVSNERDQGSISSRPTIGSIAPGFNCKDINDNLVSLKEHLGRVVLVDFWATWCPPCRQEVPWLVKAYGAHHNNGFDILSFSSDDSLHPNDVKSAAEIVRTFTRQHGMDWPEVFDTDLSVAHAYGSGGGGIPYSFLVGRDGKICAIDPRGKDIEPAVIAALNIEPQTSAN